MIDWWAMICPSHLAYHPVLTWRAAVVLCPGIIWWSNPSAQVQPWKKGSGYNFHSLRYDLSWRSNPQPTGLSVDNLPLSHCANRYCRTRSAWLIWPKLVCGATCSVRESVPIYFMRRCQQHQWSFCRKAQRHCLSLSGRWTWTSPTVSPRDLQLTKISHWDHAPWQHWDIAFRCQHS